MKPFINGVIPGRSRIAISDTNGGMRQRSGEKTGFPEVIELKTFGIIKFLCGVSPHPASNSLVGGTNLVKRGTLNPAWEVFCLKEV